MSDTTKTIETDFYYHRFTALGAQHWRAPSVAMSWCLLAEDIINVPFLRLERNRTGDERDPRLFSDRIREACQLREQRKLLREPRVAPRWTRQPPDALAWLRDEDGAPFPLKDTEPLYEEVSWHVLQHSKESHSSLRELIRGAVPGSADWSEDTWLKKLPLCCQRAPTDDHLLALIRILRGGRMVSAYSDEDQRPEQGLMPSGRGPLHDVWSRWCVSVTAIARLGRGFLGMNEIRWEVPPNELSKAAEDLDRRFENLFEREEPTWRTLVERSIELQQPGRTWRDYFSLQDAVKAGAYAPVHLKGAHGSTGPCLYLHPSGDELKSRASNLRHLL